jgi:sugar phosphate isomerase/epimerase
MATERGGLTRREWLAMTVGSGAYLASSAAAWTQSHAGGRLIGVQLYTVREQLARDPGATLKAIADIGYRELEIIQGTLPKVVPIAKTLGLTPVSVHVDNELVLGDAKASRPKLDSVLESVAASGAKFAVMAWIPVERRPTSGDGFAQLGASLNAAAERAQAAGLRFAYHNHAFEFAPLKDGKRALDTLMAASDPSMVRLELDAFWAAVAGSNPVDVLRQYSGRVALMHLKDPAPGIGPVFREDQVPPGAFREVGSGSLDFAAILSAADAAGVEHYFVEQDHTIGSPLDSLRKSFEYLRTLRARSA